MTNLKKQVHDWLMERHPKLAMALMLRPRIQIIRRDNLEEQIGSLRKVRGDKIESQDFLTRSLIRAEDASSEPILDFCKNLYQRLRLLSPVRFKSDQGQVSRHYLELEEKLLAGKILLNDLGDRISALQMANPKPYRPRGKKGKRKGKRKRVRPPSKIEAAKAAAINAELERLVKFRDFVELATEEIQDKFLAVQSRHIRKIRETDLKRALDLMEQSQSHAFELNKEINIRICELTAQADIPLVLQVPIEDLIPTIRRVEVAVRKRELEAYEGHEYARNAKPGKMGKVLTLLGRLQSTVGETEKQAKEASLRIEKLLLSAKEFLVAEINNYNSEELAALILQTDKLLASLKTATDGDAVSGKRREDLEKMRTLFDERLQRLTLNAGEDTIVTATEEVRKAQMQILDAIEFKSRNLSQLAPTEDPEELAVMIQEIWKARKLIDTSSVQGRRLRKEVDRVVEAWLRIYDFLVEEQGASKAEGTAE